MLVMRIGVALLFAFGASSPALAHGGHQQGLAWTLDPLLTVPLAVTLIVYLVGRARLSRRASAPLSTAAR
jgi:hypothetical protein